MAAKQNTTPVTRLWRTPSSPWRKRHAGLLKCRPILWLILLFLPCVSMWAGPTSAAIRPQAAFVVAASDENQRLSAVAYAPTETVEQGKGVFLAVWQEGWQGVGGDSQIFGKLIRPGSVAGEQKPLRICAEKNHQEAPQLTFAGGVFLVVWHDFRNGVDADIYGARVTPDGKILDPKGIAIAVRPHNQNFPIICANGSDFLVLWREVRYGRTYDLMGARVESKTGKTLDPKGILLAKDATAPSVGFSGKRYIIGWLDAGRRRKLRFCRYDPQTLRREEEEAVTVGHPDAFGKIGQMKFVSGPGEVIALWARGIGTDNWGWGGPGAILTARIKEDGTVPEGRAFNKIRWSPEGREQYTKRLLPGVLDTARWKDFDDRWPQGKPGGFKEAANGFWPHAYLAATALPGAPGGYFAVWVRAHLKGLNQTGRFDILGGRLISGASLEAPDFPPAELVMGGCATLPAVSAGAAGEPVLVLYEEVGQDGKPVVKGKFVDVAETK